MASTEALIGYHTTTWYIALTVVCCSYHQYWLLIPSIFCPGLAAIFNAADSRTVSTTLNRASCVHICYHVSVRYVFRYRLRNIVISVNEFAGSIIFPKFLALHKIFGSFLPRQIYQRTHVSYLMTKLRCCIPLLKLLMKITC